MLSPCCSAKTIVMDSRIDTDGTKVRQRFCKGCGEKFVTREVSIPSNTVKRFYRDNRRPLSQVS